jgi:hypothetical protein
VLVAVPAIYLLIHLGVLRDETNLWLASVQAGQGNTWAAYGRLFFAAFEASTIAYTAWVVHSLVYKGLTNAQLADRGLVVLGFFMPMFQHLMAANNPSFLEGQRSWWAFHASLMMLGVVYGFTPAHSLIQALLTVAPFT